MANQNDSSSNRSNRRVYKASEFKSRRVDGKVRSSRFKLPTREKADEVEGAEELEELAEEQLDLSSQPTEAIRPASATEGAGAGASAAVAGAGAMGAAGAYVASGAGVPDADAVPTSGASRIWQDPLAGGALPIQQPGTAASTSRQVSPASAEGSPADMQASGTAPVQEMSGTGTHPRGVGRDRDLDSAFDDEVHDAKSYGDEPEGEAAEGSSVADSAAALIGNLRDRVGQIADKVKSRGASEGDDAGAVEGETTPASDEGQSEEGAQGGDGDMFDKPARAFTSPAELARSLSKQRIVGIAVAVVALIVIIWLVTFAFNRCARYDDHADMQGSWYVMGTSVPIQIDDGHIYLTDDVSYEYTINDGDKTIRYTYGPMEGQGRYWFSDDRQSLVITDGKNYTGASTAFDDLATAFRSLLSSSDALSEMLDKDGVIGFSRNAEDGSLASEKASGESASASGESASAASAEDAAAAGAAAGAAAAGAAAAGATTEDGTDGTSTGDGASTGDGTSTGDGADNGTTSTDSDYDSSYDNDSGYDSGYDSDSNYDSDYNSDTDSNYDSDYNSDSDSNDDSGTDSNYDSDYDSSYDSDSNYDSGYDSSYDSDSNYDNGYDSSYDSDYDSSYDSGSDSDSGDNNSYDNNY